MDEMNTTSMQTIPPMSGQINELAKAMAAAQTEIKPATKSADNPYFKSKYADLAEIFKVSLPALNKNGISVLQFPETDGKRVTVTTMLLHSSGQFITNRLTIMAKAEDAQAQGSAITYAKRYSLSAMVGVAAEEDDDGNAAAGNTPQRQKPAPRPAPRPTPIKEAAQARQQMQAPPVSMFDEPEEKHLCSECGTEIKANVHNFSVSKYGRALCYNCQKKVQG